MTNKSSITRLKDIPELKNAVDLLLGGDQLSLQQKEFLLSTAVLLIRDFEKKPISSSKSRVCILDYPVVRA